MKFRPCIDLHNGKVKQIVGGTLTEEASGLKENFISDRSAGYYAELYRKDGLTGGHVIMLGPGNREAALEALEAYPGGLQIGGGINPENAVFFLEAGASHVIVTSWVFRDGRIDWERLEEMTAVVGKKRLVLDLSCRKVGDEYRVFTDRWQRCTEFSVHRKNLDRLAGFCDEFLVHAADVEGRCSGIQEDLVHLLGGWEGLPITYAGGIHQMGDLEMINRASSGALDFTIGSALDLFGGSLSYREIIRWKPE